MKNTRPFFIVRTGALRYNGRTARIIAPRRVRGFVLFERGKGVQYRLSILEQVRCSADVKALPREALPLLCAELREKIIAGVSETGGHLASSLGAVELTVALHRVYDTARDRVVFDVGHQCYAHKLLTGRQEAFSTLRQFGGLSGFPKPCEAPDDAAIAGHASTSISNALGMARARTILGGDYDVCAVIGDGAMTGGLAYEGLADCGESGEPIVVVLNDNAMSISESVGGFARMLAKMRVRPGYIAFKRAYRRTVGKYEHVYRVIHRVKEWVKDLVMPDNLFEEMGFYYLGPIDGHDIRTVSRTLQYARELRIPVLVHVRTVKGRGYAPAERSPDVYHGVSPFDPEQGIRRAEKQDFSAVFGEALRAEAEADERIVAVTAAMADGTGLTRFAHQFPKRFFDVGIAEGHAVSLAAGMSRQGLRPVAAIYSSFLQRAFDMLIHDVSLSGESVVLAVDRAGLVGADGETHQGSFDVGYLCQVPGLRLWSPANFAELRSMLARALRTPGPTALRYPRGGEGAFREDTSALDAAPVRPGRDAVIVTYGVLVNEAFAAAEELEKQGVSAAVLKLNRLDAPDFDLICKTAAETGAVLAAEETAEAGCVGTRILAEMARRGIAAKAALRNLGSGVVPQGTVAELRAMLGLDAAGLAAAVRALLGEDKG